MNKTMDHGLMERMKNVSLTDADARSLIDWQLTRSAEKIDHKLINECLLYLYPDEPGIAQEGWQALRGRLLAMIRTRAKRRAQQTHRRRLPAKTAVIAMLLLLLLAGVAIAATLGIFGRFIGAPDYEMSSQRLEHLVEEAQNVGQTVAASAPTAEPGDVPMKTEYDRLLARQYGRQFELTVDQAYCDGNKLYYSYMLCEPNRSMILGEGKPTGFDGWDWEHPGERVEDDPRWMIGMSEEENAKAREWLAGGEGRYVAYDFFGLGDGADLNDGTEKGVSLMIFDSGVETIDAYTKQGFQQADLPEGYVPGETIDFYLTIIYNTTVIYQDETGYYEATVRQQENRGFMNVPFTAQVTGKPEEFVKTAVFDEYTAEAHLAISDVDISGTVYIDAPQAWIDDFDDWEDQLPDKAHYVYDYKLIADGVECPNVGGGYGMGIHDEQWKVYVRYDLPESMESLMLVPSRSGLGETPSECIVIR